MKTHLPASRILPAVAALCASVAFLPAAHAVVVNQVDGVFRVPCAADSVSLLCINQGFSRSFTDRGVGTRGSSDSFDNTLLINGHQHYTKAEWYGQATTGSLKTGAFATLITPIGDPVFSSERSTAFVEGFFSDDWTIRGPTNSLRRIKLHFSLDGSVDDLAGIDLPFGREYAGNGVAFGRLSTSIGLDSGTNRFLGPVAVGATGGLLEHCIGRGGCAPAGSQNQSFDLFFDVAGGNLLSIFAMLTAEAVGSAYADFLHTAKLDYVLAPDDIDILTGSGDLIRKGDRFIYRANDSIDPPPPTGLPEPSSGLLAGLGLILAWVSRRIRRPVRLLLETAQVAERTYEAACTRNVPT